ncbi:TetR/AcrR family transcriptional regulator [Galactobacter caseinivorans]|uniref:TetR/AcrR family transcriptional regulator n=1 Tax=Galactobacter caseinivorans TaxID=2676123 RepID=A0A496PK59_9MICC|nr:TetR/AcrR family transcriptional regulator [Galactobacter caseinivorans]RKW70861.1 TetR/AcrR family transcriptional regulator [Galactobacter caseinivorans]
MPQPQSTPSTQAASSRRSGRPAGSILSREVIGHAALELIDQHGFEAMTMKALATDLGVAASALYNHVENKAELWIPIQEQLMGEVDSSAFQRLPLQRAMAAWARSYRDVFAAHPHVIAGIARLPVAGSPQTLAHYEAVATALAQAGLPQTRIVSVIVAFESFIFGSALDVTAPDDIFDSGDGQQGHPVFAGAVAARAALPAHPADDAFDLGLDALLGVLPARS